MMLSSDKGEREEMGIEELTLNGWAYKESKGGGEQRTRVRKNPKTISPISETCFIHNQSIPLSPKHVSTQPINTPISETRFIHSQSIPLFLKHVLTQP